MGLPSPPTEAGQIKLEAAVAFAEGEEAVDEWVNEAYTVY